MVTVPLWLLIALCLVLPAAGYSLGSLRARKIVARFFGGENFLPHREPGRLRLKMSDGQLLELDSTNPEGNAIAIVQDQRLRKRKRGLEG